MTWQQEGAISTSNAITEIGKGNYEEAGMIGGEKLAELSLVLATEGVGAAAGKGLQGLKALRSLDNISNPVPDKLARVIPNDVPMLEKLGLPRDSEVFVTAADDLKNLNATQIAEKLAIPECSSGFKVIEFKTPQNIATPISSPKDGFVGHGRTAGGAREFVIPNQDIPAGATQTIVE